MEANCGLPAESDGRHSSLNAKQTFNRIGAHGRFKLNGSHAAEIPNSVKLYHVAV